MTDRIVFAAVMILGIPALAFDFGQQYQADKVAKVCPQVQGERLYYSEQYRDRTICTYSAEPSYGMAKRKRKA